MALTRGARIVLSLVVLFSLVVLAAAVGAAVLLTRGPDVPSGSVLWLRLPPGLVERQPDDLLGQLGGPRTDLATVVETLRAAADDDRIEAVVLAPSPQGAPWGSVQEIRGAVEAFRASGKRIAAYLEYGASQAYYLALACDEVFMAPTSTLDLVGVAIYEPFAREALDKIGAYPDMLHAGEFKTAVNVYTESTFTPAHREMTQSLARDLHDQLALGVARGRRMLLADAYALIDDGPFLPAEALARGLVDGLLYEDELLERLGGETAPARPLGLDDYGRVAAAATLGRDDRPALAVVHVVGTIVHGGGAAGAASLVEALRAAREDDEIEGIVLRINSPGGSATASDLIWREVGLAAEAKPLVVSMSDLAASGGYYVAAPADVVVAHPATLTGSIGVFGGKLAIGEALTKIGVAVEDVSAGRMASIWSPTTPFSDEQRARLQKQIDAFYTEFLTRVAEGRGMSRDAVHAVAQGRVWTGRQAHAAGLVDELGGMSAAVAAAKRLADIDAQQQVRLVPYPRPRSFVEVLSDGLSVGSGSGLRAELLSMLPAAAGAAAVAPLGRFRPGETLALMPFVYVW